MNHPAILRIVGRIRRKLQLERLVQGLAWSTGLILPASVLGSYLLTQANFSTVALFSSRLFLATVVVFSLLRFLVLPQLRRPSKRLVARFLEERHPQLQDRLSTAVELARTATSADPLFRELVVRDAQGRLRALPQPRLYQPTATRVALLILALSSLVFAWLFWAGPPAYSYSLARLVQPRRRGKVSVAILHPGDSGQHDSRQADRCGGAGQPPGVRLRQGPALGQVPGPTRLGRRRHADG